MMSPKAGVSGASLGAQALRNGSHCIWCPFLQWAAFSFHHSLMHLMFLKEWMTRRFKLSHFLCPDLRDYICDESCYTASARGIPVNHESSSWDPRKTYKSELESDLSFSAESEPKNAGILHQNQIHTAEIALGLFTLKTGMLIEDGNSILKCSRDVSLS